MANARIEPETVLPGAIEFAGQIYSYCNVATAFGKGFTKLPHVLRLLLENALRNSHARDRAALVAGFQAWLIERRSDMEIPFLPNRIMMHDTTCGPALVDIAAMRVAGGARGRSCAASIPVLPVDVSTDHSSAVDVFGTRDALARNLEMEFGRNAERYR